MALDGGSSHRPAPADFVASQRSSLVPRLLLLLIVLLLVGVTTDRWLVVEDAAKLDGWAIADFARLQASYLLGLVLWSFVLLETQRLAWVVRLVTLTLVLHVVAVEQANSEILAYTGALAPSDVIYYMAEAVDSLPLSIASTELLTLVAVPILFLATGFYCWSQIYATPGRRRQAWLLAAAAGILLAGATVAPLANGLELNTARPSYIYHVLEYLKRKTYLRVPKRAPRPPRRLELAAKAAGGPHPNLVIIALESVGADATTLYGTGQSGVTPYLESLAGESWVADRAYSIVPHTSKALVAINCGLTPYLLHPIFESTLGIPATCLPGLLESQGYDTAFFQSPTENFENRRGLVEKMGFDHFVAGDGLAKDGDQMVSYFGYEDDILLAPSRAWLAERQGRPFFSFYLTGATHHPYWTPDRYDYVMFRARSVEHNRYLNSVRYLDHFIENVIRQYKDAGLYENTIFVIVGDHGESISQHHRRQQHNASVYEETVHIPLLIHGPGVPHGRSDRVFSQVDLLPSLVSLLGFEGRGEMEGFSAFEPGAPPRESAMAACWFEYWCVATVDERYKYIFNFDQKPEELYDLRVDPAENRNLAAGRPEQVAELRRRTLERYQADIGDWEAFLGGQDPDFWSHREATLGTPLRLFALPRGDRRLKDFLRGE